MIPRGRKVRRVDYTTFGEAPYPKESPKRAGTSRAFSYEGIQSDVFSKRGVSAQTGPLDLLEFSQKTAGNNLLQ